MSDIPVRPPVKAGEAVWALILLCMIYFVSLLDRIILTLLVHPLQARFHVQDVQISLLYGTSFALVFCISGVFLARFADRGDRRHLILFGVGLWSAGTLSSAFAQSFPILILCRAGLAIGEAALAPAAYSLIGDMFTAQRRSLASSLFLASGSVGSFLAFIVGGVIVAFSSSLLWNSSSVLHALEPWRRVMLLVGLPGIPVAVLLCLSVVEPPRQATGASSIDQPDWRAVVRHVSRNWRTYVTLMLGCTSTSAVSQSISAWMPEILHRNFGLPIAKAGIWTGLSGMLAISFGILVVPIAAERFRRRGRPNGLIVAVALCASAGYGLAILAMFAASPVAMLLLVVPALALLSGCVSIGFNAMMEIVPATMRATLMALMLIVTTLVGIGLGPSLCAMMASELLGGPAHLNLGVVMVTAVAIPITFGSIVLGWSSFRQGMVLAAL